MIEAEARPAGSPVRCAGCGDVLTLGARRCPRDGTLVGERIDPLAGATLAGRYRLIARLGRGGMSSVYLARHVVIDRLSAVKILRSDLARDATQRDRFLREARAVNRIQHENIIEITDYGETADGLVFLVMEYVPGDSLLTLTARGPVEARRAIDIGCQIAGALGRAHQMNVVHRDLKPDNVLLVRRDDGSDLVKLLDFGIAKVLDAPSLTMNRRIFGTPGYIAPEYAVGGELTTRSDLYALGIVLYELVTCALPFDAEHMGQLLMKHISEPPIPPRTRNPAVPEALEKVILRCLAKKPEDRHRDAYHLLDELRQVRAALDASDELPSVMVERSHSSPGVHIHGVANFRMDDTPTRIHKALLQEETRHRSVPPNLPTLPDGAPALRDVLGQDHVLGVPWPAQHDVLALPDAWTAFLDGVRERAEGAQWSPLPPAARDALGAMERHVGTMRGAIEATGRVRERMLALESYGREFRESIGRAIDALAAELSQKERDRAAAAERQDVEFQLRTLSARIDQLNENLESDRGALMNELNQHLDALREADMSMRHAAIELERVLNQDTRTNR